MTGGKDGTLRVFEVDSGQQILHVSLFVSRRAVCDIVVQVDRLYWITFIALNESQRQIVAGSQHRVTGDIHQRNLMLCGNNLCRTHPNHHHLQSSKHEHIPKPAWFVAGPS